MLTVAVGDVIEGEVCDFASEGEGIVKIGAYAVFVPFAIKGEIIRARVRYAKKITLLPTSSKSKNPRPNASNPNAPITALAAVAICNTCRASVNSKSKNQTSKTH